ncbi:MAG: DUF1015 domain-containing protein [Comamonadaceae bacterium]|nr:DUF1015 domain-containing protein [Comamonadaceae bacterium]
MQILDYNRVVKDLNGLTREQFLAPGRRELQCRRRAGRGEAGRTRRVRHVSRRAAGTGCISDPSSSRPTTRSARLDVSLLQDNLLGADPRHRRPAARQAHRLRRRHPRSRASWSGAWIPARWRVAFALHPTSMARPDGGGRRQRR